MKCGICQSKDLELMYSNKNQFIYTQGVCEDSADLRLSKINELTYYFCNSCGYIFNPYPITSENDDTYKELYTLNLQNLSDKDKISLNNILNLILQYTNLDKGKSILEIGSSDGYFLDMFNQEGYDCIGIEPSSAVEICKERYPYIKIIRDYYNPKLFNKNFDLIICRNVIEHLENPINFIISIKNLLKQEVGFVYFEVPNVQKILENKLYTNLYHEHISYFHKELFELINISLGFETKFISIISDGDVIAYIGQDKSTSNKYKLKTLPNIKSLKKNLKSFSNNLLIFKSNIQGLFQNLINKNLKIGIWGAGCTAINIISFSDNMEYKNFYLFDSSETKIGKFLPGFCKVIKSPNDINYTKPDVMIIMSERYIDEIYFSLKQMHFSNDIWTIYPDIKKLN